MYSGYTGFIADFINLQTDKHSNMGDCNSALRIVDSLTDDAGRVSTFVSTLPEGGTCVDIERNLANRRSNQIRISKSHDEAISAQKDTRDVLDAEYLCGRVEQELISLRTQLQISQATIAALQEEKRSKSSKSTFDREYWKRSLDESENRARITEDWRNKNIISDENGAGKVLDKSATTETLTAEPDNRQRLQKQDQPRYRQSRSADRSKSRTGTGSGNVRKASQRLTAASKHAPNNTSTGSSTSGVEISSTSSRSELPLRYSALTGSGFPLEFQHRGISRDIKEGGAYLKNEFDEKISVECIAGGSDRDSLSSLEDPLNIYRTSSFKRAIERGNSRDCLQAEVNESEENQSADNYLGKGASFVGIDRGQGRDKTLTSARSLDIDEDYHWLWTHAKPNNESTNRISSSYEALDYSHSSVPSNKNNSEFNFDLNETFRGEHRNESFNDVTDSYQIYKYMCSDDTLLDPYNHSKKDQHRNRLSWEANSNQLAHDIVQYDSEKAGIPDYSITTVQYNELQQPYDYSSVMWKNSQLWDVAVKKTGFISADTGQIVLEDSADLDWIAGPMEPGSPTRRRCLSTLTEEDSSMPADSRMGDPRVSKAQEPGDTLGVAVNQPQMSANALSTVNRVKEKPETSATVKKSANEILTSHPASAGEESQIARQSNTENKQNAKTVISSFQLQTSTSGEQYSNTESSNIVSYARIRDSNTSTNRNTSSFENDFIIKEETADRGGKRFEALSLVGKSRRKSLQEKKNTSTNESNKLTTGSEFIGDTKVNHKDLLHSPGVESLRSLEDQELYITADPTLESLALSEDGGLEESDVTAEVFPSLTEEVLRKLSLYQSSDVGPEDHSLQDSEEKFSSLSLAFKTDRQTLEKRIEVNIRARDVAEANIQKELEGLRAGIKSLGHLCVTSSSQEAFSSVQRHMEVLEQSIARVSSRAEVHGAVQQELRVSHVIDAMLSHVENLKKSYDKEHEELERMKKFEESQDVVGVTDISLSSALKGERRRLSLVIPAGRPQPQPRSNLTAQPISERDLGSVNRFGMLTGALKSSITPAAAIVNSMQLDSTQRSTATSKQALLRFKSVVQSSTAPPHSVSCDGKIESHPLATTNQKISDPAESKSTIKPLSNGEHESLKGLEDTGQSQKKEEEDDRLSEIESRELYQRRREALKRSFSRRISMHVSVPEETRMERLKESVDSCVRWAHETLGGDMMPGLVLFSLVLIIIICLLIAIRFSRFGAFLLFLFSIGR